MFIYTVLKTVRLNFPAFVTNSSSTYYHMMAIVILTIGKCHLDSSE